MIVIWLTHQTGFKFCLLISLHIICFVFISFFLYWLLVLGRTPGNVLQKCLNKLIRQMFLKYFTVYLLVGMCIYVHVISAIKKKIVWFCTCTIAVGSWIKKKIEASELDRDQMGTEEEEVSNRKPDETASCRTWNCVFEYVLCSKQWWRLWLHTEIHCVPVTESHLSISKYCVHISFTIQSLVLSVIVYPVRNVYMYSLLQNTLYMNHIV